MSATQSPFVSSHSPWFWAVPGAAALAMIVVGLSDGNYGLFMAVNRVSELTGSWLWANLTMFGDTLVVFTLALLLVGRRPEAVWALMLAALVATALVHGPKDWLNVSRPPLILGVDAINVIGDAHRSLAFPSGHTAAAFTFAGVIAMMRFIALPVKLLLVLLAVLVGVSRVAVGVHWPLDVMGGAVVGWVAAAAGAAIAVRWRWGLGRTAQRLFALLMLGCALALPFHNAGYPQARLWFVLLALWVLAGAWPQLRGLMRGPWRPVEG